MSSPHGLSTIAPGQPPFIFTAVHRLANGYAAATYPSALRGDSAVPIRRRGPVTGESDLIFPRIDAETLPQLYRPGLAAHGPALAIRSTGSGCRSSSQMIRPTGAASASRASFLLIGLVATGHHAVPYVILSPTCPLRRDSPASTRGTGVPTDEPGFYRQGRCRHRCQQGHRPGRRRDPRPRGAPRRRRRCTQTPNSPHCARSTTSPSCPSTWVTRAAPTS